MNLLLNERTEKKLSVIGSDLPHAILLTGKKGVGLSTIAKQLAGKNTAALVEPKDSKGDIRHETGTISVEVIRTLYEQTRAKTTSRQIVIIDGADRMSLGAQAAFLKLLEEPTENTHFILTAHTLQAILPTIRSRVQTTPIEPLSTTKTSAFLDSLGIKDLQVRKQLEYLAGGLPAEIQRLVDDDTYFKLRAEIMGDTRKLLTGTVYDKLLVVHKYYQDRARSIQLIDSALIVSGYSLRAKPTAQLIGQLNQLLYAREKIEGNCNIRLQLTAFALASKTYQSMA